MLFSAAGLLWYFFITIVSFLFSIDNVIALVRSTGVIYKNPQMIYIWKATIPPKQSLYFSNKNAISTRGRQRTNYFAQSSLSSSSPLSLNELTSKAFDTVSSGKTIISWQKISNWETILDEVTQEIKSIKEPKALLNFYESILQKVAPILLDPLQISTFEVIANAIIDTLISLFPRNTPITALIDEITDLHLEFIERFRSYIDASSDVDDGYVSYYCDYE